MKSHHNQDGRMCRVSAATGLRLEPLQRVQAGVLDVATPRSGQQAALGADVVALLDALEIPRAVLAGYDGGGRAACVFAALWPERCTGLMCEGISRRDPHGRGCAVQHVR